VHWVGLMDVNAYTVQPEGSETRPRPRPHLCGLVTVSRPQHCSGAGAFAAATLACHVKYTRDQWATGSNYLRALMLVGCSGQLAGVCAFSVYLALAVSQHQGLRREFYSRFCSLSLSLSLCLEISSEVQ